MMTMFRDEIGFLWGALFGLLIFFRVFAWLAADRVAYIEVNPNMSRGSYLRVRDNCKLASEVPYTHTGHAYTLMCTHDARTLPTRFGTRTCPQTDRSQGIRFCVADHTDRPPPLSCLQCW